MDGMDEDELLEPAPTSPFNEEQTTPTKPSRVVPLPAMDVDSEDDDSSFQSSEPLTDATTLSSAQLTSEGGTTQAGGDEDWSLLAQMLGIAEAELGKSPPDVVDDAGQHGGMADFLNVLGLEPTDPKVPELAGSDIFDFAAFGGGGVDIEVGGRACKTDLGGAGGEFDEGFMAFMSSLGCAAPST